MRKEERFVLKSDIETVSRLGKEIDSEEVDSWDCMHQCRQTIHFAYKMGHLPAENAWTLLRLT